MERSKKGGIIASRMPYETQSLMVDMAGMQPEALSSLRTALRECRSRREDIRIAAERQVRELMGDEEIDIQRAILAFTTVTGLVP